jgi:uncharacterized protein YlxW (UPF0749 family)
MTEALKTIILQGALTTFIFGAYNQFTTNTLMELNNENMKLQHKQDMKNLKDEHNREMIRQRKEIDNLNEKYKQLELLVQSRRWF